MKALGRRILSLVCACSMLTSLAFAAEPATDTAQGGSVQVQQEAAATGRETISLNADWKYAEAENLGEAEDATLAGSDYDDAAWEEVQLPHTWNAEDGADGGSYRRGTSWYRKTLTWDESYAERRLYVEFLGSSLVTDVYVNGQLAGHHEGGYTAFRYDITGLVTPGEDIQLAVKVNNERNANVLPLGGDFTLFGGIYRNVSLIVTDPVHIEQTDNGASGVYLTPTVSEDLTDGTLDMTVKLKNDSLAAEDVTVVATLKQPDGFEAISSVTDPRFDTSDMGDGSEVGTTSGSVTLEAGAAGVWEGEIQVEDVRLWNGVEDPFRYVAVIEVQVDGETVDSFEQYIGFRTFEVDAEKGFILNGEPYALRGVSRHQDGYDVTGETYLGSALTYAEHERDLGIIYELGANYVRLAHYPQEPYFYELCDRYGLVVWAEIPLVGGATESEEFQDNAELQLVEMIRQHYNHPSICFWGIANEISSTDFVTKMISALNKLAHEEDPNRLTTYAAERNGDGTWEADLIGWNVYPNWYYEGTMEGMLSERMGELSGGKPVGVSEYGAGANIAQHEDPPQFSIGQSRGQWHPEEYQGVWHEDALRDIQGMDYLWSTAVWNMFDFGSDGRNEGGQLGINDKGLVTIDRQTKKDAFYLYKANWNTWESFVHINASRYNPREDEVITVRAYSNCDELELFVNGESYGVAQNDGIGVFEWENVTLQLGENTVKAVSKADDSVTDEITWTRQMGSTPKLNSSLESVVMDNPNATITLLDTVTVGALKAAITGVNGTTWALYQADGETVVTDESLEVSMDMVIKATSQDGKTTTTYRFGMSNLAADKTVTASTQLKDYPASNVVDLDGATYWSADRGSKAQITVDLGAVYCLNNVAVDWYNTGSNARTYRYTIEVSEDGEEYTVAADLSQNDQSVDTESRRLKIKSELDNVYGRYVKINITGGPSWSECAEISEIVINGWRMTSSVYEIDNAEKVIYVPTPEAGVELTWQQFAEDLTVEGTHTDAAEFENSAYFVLDGDKWKITDSDGNETIYTVHFSDDVNPSGDYEVTFVSNGETYGKQSVAEGEKVVEPAEPQRDGYYFDGWYTDEDCTALYNFDAPVTGNLTLYAKWIVITAGRDKYDISISVQGGGDVLASAGSSSAANPITLTVKADAGYVLSDLTVTDSQGNELELTDKGEGKYTFQMPESNVSVEAVFVKDGTAPVEPEDGFQDVAEDAWYFDAVEYAVEKGFMAGVSASSFAPDAQLTRAQLAQMLYALSGAPEVTESAGFTDVAESAWYAKAVNWAAAEKLVSGYGDGTFGPDDALTREQLTAILYAYAKSEGADVSGKADLSKFTDIADLSAWAEVSMAWAVDAGLVGGMEDGTLAPAGTATRAQMAQIMMNLLEKVL